MLDKNNNDILIILLLRRKIYLNEVYTIGYTAFSYKKFLKIILEYNISCIIDVRSNPYSKQYPEYNKEYFEKTLKKEKILYRNYKYEFGARQDNRCFYSKEGHIDFLKFIKSDIFYRGVEKLQKGIDMKYRFVLMCAEKNPINCHRSIMLGKGFKDYGFNVKHITVNGIITQEDIEAQLLDIYFKNKEQLTILYDKQDEQQLILESYKRRNMEIGHRWEGKIY